MRQYNNELVLVARVFFNNAHNIYMYTPTTCAPTSPLPSSHPLSHICCTLSREANVYVPVCVCVCVRGWNGGEHCKKRIKKRRGYARNNSVKNKKQHLEHPRTLHCVCMMCTVYIIFTIRDKKKSTHAEKKVPVILLFFYGLPECNCGPVRMRIRIYLYDVKYNTAIYTAVVSAGADQPGNA